VIETEEYISEEGLKNSSAKLLPKDTILVAMYGATVGQLSLTSKDKMTCNQAICAILEGEYSFPFCLLLLKHYKKDWTGLAIGSAQQNLSQVTISSYEIIIPSIQIELKFTQVIKPLYSNIKNNFEEIQTLTQLRDTLLPKLMSGELRVNS
jgi:type I restriction enzyme S subunit